MTTISHNTNAHVPYRSAAECQSMPLVGAREPLEALAAEYQDGSQVFTTKIHALSKQYTAVRRTRGDGNCFFRSFLFAHLESMAAGRNAAARQQCVIIHPTSNGCRYALCFLFHMLVYCVVGFCVDILLTTENKSLFTKTASSQGSKQPRGACRLQGSRTSSLRTTLTFLLTSCSDWAPQWAPWSFRSWRPSFAIQTRPTC